MIFLMGSAVALHLEDANAFINSIFIAYVHLFLFISLSLSLCPYIDSSLRVSMIHRSEKTREIVTLQSLFPSCSYRLV